MSGDGFELNGYRGGVARRICRKGEGDLRKVFLHINVSLDGFIEDDNHEIDWHFVDDEFEEYINDLLSSIDGMIFGRVAHQLLAEYWPTAASRPEASPRDVEAAGMMISNGSYQTEWQNSHVISGDVAGEIRKLKDQPSKDIALFAGAGVAQSFMELNLLDEYRLVLNFECSAEDRRCLRRRTTTRTLSCSVHSHSRPVRWCLLTSLITGYRTSDSH